MLEFSFVVDNKTTSHYYMCLLFPMAPMPALNQRILISKSDSMHQHLRSADVGAGLEPDHGVPVPPDLLAGEVTLVLLCHLGSWPRRIYLLFN